MLDVATRFLGDQLNEYLRNRGLSVGEVGEVVLGPIVDDTGKWATAADKVGLTLINVEEERVLREQAPQLRATNGGLRLTQPELKLNLSLMFHSRPSPGAGKYEQSLRFLAHVMTWFQINPVFLPERFPSLDPRIAKLVVELQSYSAEQLNQLWTYLGSKYLPSVVYRVRMVVLAGTEAQDLVSPVLHVESAIALAQGARSVGALGQEGT